MDTGTRDVGGRAEQTCDGSTTSLAYYDPSNELVIQCDASSTGLGSTLMQEGKPIANASSPLSTTETFFFSRILLTVCCHSRAHAFARYVAVTMSLGGSRAHQVAGSRGGGPLFEVHHTRSWPTVCCQCGPISSSLSLHGQPQCSGGSADAIRATVVQTLLVELQLPLTQLAVSWLLHICSLV